MNIVINSRLLMQYSKQINDQVKSLEGKKINAVINDELVIDEQEHIFFVINNANVEFSNAKVLGRNYDTFYQGQQRFNKINKKKLHHKQYVAICSQSVYCFDSDKKLMRKLNNKDITDVLINIDQIEFKSSDKKGITIYTKDMTINIWAFVILTILKENLAKEVK